MKGIRFGAIEDEISDEQASASGISLESLEAEHQPNQPHYRITPEQQSLLSQLESKKQARVAIVPTADMEVRKCLIEVGEPMTLFGEGPYERRERLKSLVANPSKPYRRILEEFLAEKKKIGKPEAAVGAEDNEEFFVPGSEELVEARKWTSQYSLKRSAQRLQKEREFRQMPIAEVKERRLDDYALLGQYKDVASQVGCDRPLSYGSFSPDGQYFATGGFDGSCRVWAVADVQLAIQLAGHGSRTNCVKFHPSSGHLVSSCEDGSIAFWSMTEEQPSFKLLGHTARVPRIAFHPSGRYLGSTSFDYSWRLWDIERQSELQLQEGHSRPVYCIDMHTDGALVVTGGLDSIARLWDIRLGKSIWTLQGKHVKSILAAKFAPSGYEIATSSEDCTVRMWDLRSLRCSYDLPAHNSTVSDLCFTPDGTGLVTVAYDGMAKIWGRYGWKCLSTLQGHDSKIMSVDISSSGTIATTSYDHTFKLWQCN